MINQSVVEELKSILKHLKTTNAFNILKMYFEEKRKETLEDLLKESGTLTQDKIIEANSRMMVYEELMSFENLLIKDSKIYK